MRRRTFLRGAVLGAGAAILPGSFWRRAAASAQPGPGPYGALQLPDANGLQLPLGFTSRVVARSRVTVPGTSDVWHDAPDGGACFPAGDGWIYVSNSEIDSGGGGVGALRFDAAGTLRAAYPILTGSDHNCAGGKTTWGTWLSCEEVSRGRVWETDPTGTKAAVAHEAMGRFRHEAAAADPVRSCVYLTEDRPDGCLYRYVPDVWPDLAAGRLDVLCGDPLGTAPLTWVAVPDPSAATAPTRRQIADAARFDGGEGCVYADGSLWFTTKNDNRVWRLDAATDTLEVVYDDTLVLGPAPLTGVDNITRSVTGDLFVAEDNGGDMELCLITADGVLAVFCRILGHPGSEVTGPAFSPDGRRLYFSSQRGPVNQNSAGVTYEVSGPFRT